MERSYLLRTKTPLSAILTKNPGFLAGRGAGETTSVIKGMFFAQTFI